MIITILVVSLLLIFTIIFFKQQKFGRKPSGERLAILKKSPHYSDGSFNNISNTPALSEGVSYFTALKEFLFKKNPRRKPSQPLPNIKTDLLNLDLNENVLIWFGHSSYYMQLDGKTILVDPVFSGAASPISFTTKAFEGSDIYTPADFPMIDYLFVTHDHWDHMDFDTLSELRPKIRKVICGLGTGAHLTYWGYPQDLIEELDWNEDLNLDPEFSVHSIPGRHFSGRSFKRNETLWSAFIFKTPSSKIFIGGDSGYDTHFKEAGDKYGPFDLAILENGQYDKNWKYIHMQPDEVLKAAEDLKAKTLLPVHSAKFALANHAWDTPLKTITSLHSGSSPFSIITPKIGEKVALNDENQVFDEWWLGVD
ncbi:MAG: MBL fold metallo-hydrolase [Leeuwenhoekiella sp.]